MCKKIRFLQLGCQVHIGTIWRGGMRGRADSRFTRIVDDKLHPFISGNSLIVSCYHWFVDQICSLWRQGKNKSTRLSTNKFSILFLPFLRFTDSRSKASLRWKICRKREREREKTRETRLGWKAPAGICARNVVGGAPWIPRNPRDIPEMAPGPRILRAFRHYI